MAFFFFFHRFYFTRGRCVNGLHMFQSSHSFSSSTASQLSRLSLTSCFLLSILQVRGLSRGLLLSNFSSNVFSDILPSSTLFTCSNNRRRFLCSSLNSSVVSVFSLILTLLILSLLLFPRTPHAKFISTVFSLLWLLLATIHVSQLCRSMGIK